jgi:hypothetical protein
MALVGPHPVTVPIVSSRMPNALGQLISFVIVRCSKMKPQRDC